MDWTRIPIPIEAEDDRRELTGILVSAGLSVRQVKVKRNTSKSAPYDRYIEYQLPDEA